MFLKEEAYACRFNLIQSLWKTRCTECTVCEEVGANVAREIALSNNQMERGGRKEGRKEGGRVHRLGFPFFTSTCRERGGRRRKRGEKKELLAFSPSPLLAQKLSFLFPFCLSEREDCKERKLEEGGRGWKQPASTRNGKVAERKKRVLGIPTTVL